MPDKRVTELTAIDTVTGSDLVMVIDDPSGVATSKKATVAQLLAAGAAGADLDYSGDYVPATTYNDGDIVVGSDGVAYLCVKDGVTTPPEPWPSGTTPATRASLVAVFDGGGGVVSPKQVNLYVPFACTVIGWNIIADVLGSVVVDVRKTSVYPPLDIESISGTERPTLTDDSQAQDMTLTTWTPAIAAGSYLGFAIVGVPVNCTWVSVQLIVQKV